MPSLDIITSRPSFRNHLSSSRTQVQFHGRIFLRLHSMEDRRFGSIWKSHVKLRSRLPSKEANLKKQNMSVTKCVTTFEAKHLDGAEDDRGCIHNLQHGSDFQISLLSAEENPEMDEREKLRRIKISKANKGNVPWNKGRKHSPETLQKIREQTRIAMQDPKVKMKLVNLGHAQSEETRVKIGNGVRQGWQRRRKRLLVQETCCSQWQNIIAEASRKGYGGDDELRWNSYGILDEQLKKEWMESVEQRKMMVRPRSGKRAPKSLEQRKKISEAISAKWNDPEYRSRVCSALAKYHGVTVSPERNPRKKVNGGPETVKQRVLKKKISEAEPSAALVTIKKDVLRKRKVSDPVFKDPKASSNLDMIKKIREQRARMEARKREATERARLLIAEAEKAANALEAAALKSPLARASLLEARKLIAEATRSIETIKNGCLPTQESENTIPSELNETADRSHDVLEAPNGKVRADGPQVNGKTVLSPDHESIQSLRLSDFTRSYSPDVADSSSMGRSTTDMEKLQCISSPASGLIGCPHMVSESDTLALNGSYVHNNESEDQSHGEPGRNDGSKTALPKGKKTWVHGRLVEVDED